MIKIVLKRINGRDLYCPEFICDACGKMVTDAKQAHYLYLISEETYHPLTGEILITHKGACDSVLEAQQPPGAHVHWMPLEYLLAQLVFNVQLKPADVDIEKTRGPLI